MNLNRVQYVTQNYNQLQGLKFVPLGIYFILLGLDNAGYFPWLEQTIIGRTWTLWGLLLVGGLYWLISQYYSNRFGKVRRAWEDQQREEREGRIFIVLFLAAVIGDLLLRLPVGLAIIVFGGYLMYLARVRTQRYRWYYIVAGLLFIGIGFLPLFFNLSSENVFVASDVFFVAGGAAIVLTSILDHILLVRTFQLNSREQNG